MRKPFPRSYWVIPGRVCAGAYPGDPDIKTMEIKIKGLIECGISHVLNLMETTEFDHDGNPFTDYTEMFTSISSSQKPVSSVMRFPIRNLRAGGGSLLWDEEHPGRLDGVPCNERQNTVAGRKDAVLSPLFIASNGRLPMTLAYQRTIKLFHHQCFMIIDHTSARFYNAVLENPITEGMMMKARIEGNDIFNSNNKKIGSLAGNVIRDENNLVIARLTVNGILDENDQMIARITSNEIFDINGKKLASVSGSNVINSEGRRICTVKQVRREVGGGNKGMPQIAVWLLFVKEI